MLRRVKLAPARNEFQKKPLGRRQHLMSKPARSGICEFSVRYVWNGARARLRWNRSLQGRKLSQKVKQPPNKLK